MSLRIVVGPMFAGKTSEIQSVVRRSEYLGPVLVLTAANDTRYGVDAVINHDRIAVPASPVALTGLYEVLTWPGFGAAKVVVIDEAQFFSGLIDFVTAAVDRYGKHVVVVGLGIVGVLGQWAMASQQDVREIYNHYVRVDQPKSMIFVSGQLARDDDGNPVGSGSMLEQTRQCLRNIESVFDAYRVTPGAAV